MYRHTGCTDTRVYRHTAVQTHEKLAHDKRINLLIVTLQDLSAALATRNLQDSIGDSGSNQVFILQSADLVERQAVCGNLVCEAGERPSSIDGANGGNHT